MRTVLVEDQERPLVWVEPKPRHILESPKALDERDGRRHTRVAAERALLELLRGP